MASPSVDVVMMASYGKSSSSAGDAHPCSDGVAHLPPSDEPAKKKLRTGSELELLPVPERGFVFLNKPYGADTMYLVNIVTLRKVPLPASESGWQLVFFQTLASGLL